MKGAFSTWIKCVHGPEVPVICASAAKLRTSCAQPASSRMPIGSLAPAEPRAKPRLNKCPDHRRPTDPPLARFLIAVAPEQL